MDPLEICPLLPEVIITGKVANQGRVADPNITKYSVKVLPLGIDQHFSWMWI
ncbi:hypothetical protein LguiA_002811 [Lonicera macranthoides]